MPGRADPNRRERDMTTTSGPASVPTTQTPAKRAQDETIGLLIGGIILLVIGGIVIGMNWPHTVTDTGLSHYDYYTGTNTPGDVTTTTEGSMGAVSFGLIIAGLGQLMATISLIAFGVRLGI